MVAAVLAIIMPSIPCFGVGCGETGKQDLSVGKGQPDFSMEPWLWPSCHPKSLSQCLPHLWIIPTTAPCHFTTLLIFSYLPHMHKFVSENYHYQKVRHLTERYTRAKSCNGKAAFVKGRQILLCPTHTELTLVSQRPLGRGGGRKITHYLLVET